MKLQLTAIIAAIAVHMTQDMSFTYWAALIVLFICLSRIAGELDNYCMNQKKNEDGSN